MSIDQTLRGLALEIDASQDSEAQPLLEYRFIDGASTQTILARIKGIPGSTGGGGLAFETNAGAETTTQRMLIDKQGNVGIGIENPRARLEVGGDVKFNGPLDIQGALTVSGSTAIGGNLTVTGKLTAASFAGDARGLNNVSPADGSVTNAKLARDSASLSKVTDGSMVVSSEKIGIGTENPISKLHIRSGPTDSPPRLEASGARTFAAGWDFYHGETGKGYVGVPGSTAEIAPGEMLLFGAAETKLSLWAGGNRSLTVDKNANVGIGTIAPQFTLDVAGSAHASSCPTSSDARFKTNLAEVSGVLEKLKNVRAVSFEWNDLYKTLGRSTGKREIGVVAQEIETIFPELVTEWGDEKYKAIDYGRLAAVLLAAVKELAADNKIFSQQMRDLQKTSHPTCQTASYDAAM